MDISNAAWPQSVLVSFKDHIAVIKLNHEHSSGHIEQLHYWYMIVYLVNEWSIMSI